MGAGRIERLLGRYRQAVSAPWQKNLSGSERTWFAVYEPADERKLRFRLEEFAQATREAGHGWILCDLAEAFPEWMSKVDYRDAYFKQYHSDPSVMDEMLWADLAASIVRKVRDAANTEQADLAGSSGISTPEDRVVAIAGVCTLFGMLKVSDLAASFAPHVRGRLLLFFPGTYERNAYRFMDARDGWNYLALPLLSEEVHE